MIWLGQMIPSLLQSKPTITPIINRWRLLVGALCLETALIAYGCRPPPCWQKLAHPPKGHSITAYCALPKGGENKIGSIMGETKKLCVSSTGTYLWTYKPTFCFLISSLVQSWTNRGGGIIIIRTESFETLQATSLNCRVGWTIIDPLCEWESIPLQRRKKKTLALLTLLFQHLVQQQVQSWPLIQWFRSAVPSAPTFLGI